MRISKHAIDRYIQHVFGRSLGEALGSVGIRDEARSAIKATLAQYNVGAHKAEYRLRINGFAYVIKNGTLITVIPDFNCRRKLRCVPTQPTIGET
jgi:hypothetical protein